jgi:hypothetical protein
MHIKTLLILTELARYSEIRDDSSHVPDLLYNLTITQYVKSLQFITVVTRKYVMMIMMILKFTKFLRRYIEGYCSMNFSEDEEFYLLGYNAV